MNVPLLDVRISDPKLRDEIKNAVASLIDTATFVGGDPVRLFSEEFGAYCGGSCVSVANGTDALILVLRALNIGPGDEVVTVPFTFIATAEAVVNVGATLKFVDVNPKNYTIDTPSLARAITSKTKAILIVHLFGQTADMDPVLEMAKKHGIPVIEDAAQAHGAEYKGRRAGTLGDIACFSFYPTKNLGGFGDGGAVVSRSKELLAKVAQIADHGRVDRYFHALSGLNSRLDAIQAAVLRIKLRDLDKRNDRRRAIAAEYGKALASQSFITPPTVESWAKHVFHLYCVETSHRDVLMQYLKDKGIASGVYYPVPLHLQPAYAYLKLGRGSFPVSERASERILALPMYPEMTDDQVKAVTTALREFSPRN